MMTTLSLSELGVSGKAGNRIDVIIVHLFETSTLDGLPLDFLISARITHNDHIHQFGVLFSETRPDDAYPIPVLCYSNSGQLQGWLKAN